MTARLAIDGGSPVRRTLLPYGKPSLGPEDCEAVRRVLESDWLTTGPRVGEFERLFADRAGAKEAVALSSGTAALHAAVRALGIGPGDEVLVPALTFAASANCVLYEGATPVFADVDPETLLLDPASAERRAGPRTRAVVAVDFAGQPCDYGALRRRLDAKKLRILADACHSLGAREGDRPAGTLGDVSAFSLHPVKPVTTGEGGMATTDDPALARRMRVFRNHGFDNDQRERESAGTHRYAMVELGYNYRLTDLQCALGMSQLRKLPAFLERRAALAARYDEAFRDSRLVRPLARRPGTVHAWHLYVVRLDLERLRADRDTLFRALRAEGIGVQVHYQPVHLHPFYRARLGTREGLCPNAEAAFGRILTLPLFPAMSDADQDDAIRAVEKVTSAFQR